MWNQVGLSGSSCLRSSRHPLHLESPPELVGAYDLDQTRGAGKRWKKEALKCFCVKEDGKKSDIRYSQGARGQEEEEERSRTRHSVLLKRTRGLLFVTSVPSPYVDKRQAVYAGLTNVHTYATEGFKTQRGPSTFKNTHTFQRTHSGNEV
ncbi:hypothetical protein TSAR_014119 [Trichomalopsis sarcophagae]|uniref:Uncharacterized protein n=1 Tax=Trichomalopsis sarcophagae TaxID=543379 RepID=A0A232FGB5_9HYME|nr:hypothetical protein TSAR_014119 [Trichomalopsis sarcophagae]